MLTLFNISFFSLKLSPVKLSEFNPYNLICLNIEYKMFEPERTKHFVIRYALYMYFLGLSLRSKSSP